MRPNGINDDTRDETGVIVANSSLMNGRENDTTT